MMMPILKMPTSQDFANCTDKLFKVSGAENTECVELFLTNVTTLSSKVQNSQQRESFSLLFEGSAKHFLAQGLYRLDNQNLGSMEIFMVPIGQAAGGTYLYEAIFN